MEIGDIPATHVLWTEMSREREPIPSGPLDAFVPSRMFSSYLSCYRDVLGNGAKRVVLPRQIIVLIDLVGVALPIDKEVSFCSDPPFC